MLLRVHYRLLLMAWAAVPVLAQPGAVPAGQERASVRAKQLPARIMSFTAQPASVAAGQPVMLTWSTENPSGVTLDPDIGRVTPRGTRQVWPAATTTYTLTVGGPNSTTLTRTVTVNVTGGAASAAAAVSSEKKVPRMADGKPDLSGVYDFNLRPAPGAPPARPAPTANGPMLKGGAEKFKVVRGPNDAGLTSDCMPLAGPQAFGVPYQFQIAQSANHVVILHEYPGTFRIVPLTGAPHQADLDPTWMGDSIGRWDGDTLVVDTAGFNDKTEISGYKHTEALHLVERFRRSAYDMLQYDATIEDPNVFQKPWSVSRGFSLRPDLTKIDEFVCENNRDYSGFFDKK